MTQKIYEGTVYTGVVGPETENGVCRDSIHNIKRREGDLLPRFIRATKGYEAREMHINAFLNETDCAFILLLDHDQTFPPDTLEKLRSHKLPYVSGYYMRRRYNPIAPVWFKDNPDNVWPFEPFTDDPERGKLHKLGASGWGCVLIHRDVFTDMKPILKGEPYVIEDDMDVWPYDLGGIRRSIDKLQFIMNEVMERQGFIDSDVNKITDCIWELNNETQPLRGTKDPVGSDIRFPFFAKQAGYTLYGDPDVRCGHMLNYPLSPDDYSSIPDELRQQIKDNTVKEVEREREKWLKTFKALGVQL